MLLAACWRRWVLCIQLHRHCAPANVPSFQLHHPLVTRSTQPCLWKDTSHAPPTKPSFLSGGSCVWNGTWNGTWKGPKKKPVWGMLENKSDLHANKNGAPKILFYFCHESTPHPAAISYQITGLRSWRQGVATKAPISSKLMARMTILCRSMAYRAYICLSSKIARSGMGPVSWRHLDVILFNILKNPKMDPKELLIDNATLALRWFFNEKFDNSNTSARATQVSCSQHWLSPSPTAVHKSIYNGRTNKHAIQPGWR